jgi:hypothetical protein
MGVINSLSADKEPKKVIFTGVKKHLTLRNALIAVLIFLSYLIFSDLIKTVLFVAILVPAGTFSIKLTRIIPNANLEVIAPCAFFIGYLFGWPAGVFYGVILGAYMWATYYSVSQFVMLHLLLNGIAAFLGFFLKSHGMVFASAYYLGLIIRDGLFFVLGAMMGNPMENTIQTLSSIFTHLILLPTFMIILYNIAVLF